MLNTEAKNLYLNVIKNSKSILDIGANVGQSFVEYKNINPKVSVLSIEANENCAKVRVSVIILEKKVRKYKKCKEKYRNIWPAS